MNDFMRLKKVICLILSLLIFCSIGILYLRKGVLERKKIWSIINSFTSKDIHYLDNSFESTTIIEYQEHQDTYNNVRKNVNKAFENNYYMMSPDAMYIDRKLDKKGKANRIRLIGWPKYNNRSIEFTITVEYITKWNDIKITKISSENELFGKIFFDK
ncbi:hypothetical protein A7W90_08035 [Clostridium sp. Bc-iso-3]|nr:hypothetical protein A7W90_08035 [Clostridium sp. Bc-iso-3]